MIPGKTLFKPEYSAELLRIAEGDLASAKELFSVTRSGRLENVAYLAQQAAEKALKAALNHLRIPFPLVHELGVLVALLPDDKIPPGGFDLSELNPFATVRRYEEPNADLSKTEVEAALSSAAQVVRWAKDFNIEV